MTAQKLTATIKATGETIDVYKLRNGNYSDWITMTKEFTKEELTF